MGTLIRSIMKDQEKDSFFKGLVFSEEMLPELMLLGELEHVMVPSDTGKVFELDIIHYEGKRYVMTQKEVGRWFDER